MASINLDVSIWKWAMAIVVFAIGYDLSRRVEWYVRKWERDRYGRGG